MRWRPSRPAETPNVDDTVDRALEALRDLDGVLARFQVPLDDLDTRYSHLALDDERHRRP